MLKIIGWMIAGMFVVTDAWAQQPLYIVNGEKMTNIDHISPDDIDRVERLPADEQTIAQYGEEASNGVLLISLRFDSEAQFTQDSTFTRYVERHTEWTPDEPAARVVVRYTITKEGKTVVKEVLESTDKRLKRRVLRTIEEAPLWQPARKNGKAVESEGVVQVQLPEGKYLPRPVELIMR